VSDSAADFAPNEAAALGIDLVPTIVRFDSSEFLDGVTIQRDEFYAKWAKSAVPPSTAPPPPSAFEAAFRRHVAAGKSVICEVISAKISKTYENAVAGAQAFGASVHVVDSKTISGGEALLMSGAVELARNGADSDAILSAMKGWIETARGYAAFPDYEALSRTGRIDKSQILLGTTMKLFPIIRFDQDGTMHSEATVKTFDLAVELIVDATNRKMKRKRDARITITHTGAEALAEQVARDLRNKLAVEPKELSIRKAGPAVAANLGLGMVAIHWIEP
jgi:DegV family protein with EDD domain